MRPVFTAALISVFATSATACMARSGVHAAAGSVMFDGRNAAAVFTDMKRGARGPLTIVTHIGGGVHIYLVEAPAEVWLKGNKKRKSKKRRRIMAT